MKPPPPGPATNGTVTPSALAVATAASTALPPRRRTSIPARLAPTSIEATAPPVPVAVDDAGLAIGFSVVIPGDGGAHELDGLFVDPDHMLRGVGRALVADAARRASRQGAHCLEVTAGPAQEFYERVGFHQFDGAQSRFGPAVRMRRELD
jgi:GNAT superfamily N-acetyltransferase